MVTATFCGVIVCWTDTLLLVGVGTLSGVATRPPIFTDGGGGVGVGVDAGGGVGGGPIEPGPKGKICTVNVIKYIYVLFHHFMELQLPKLNNTVSTF